MEARHASHVNAPTTNPTTDTTDARQLHPLTIVGVGAEAWSTIQKRYVNFA